MNGSHSLTNKAIANTMIDYGLAVGPVHKNKLSYCYSDLGELINIDEDNMTITINKELILSAGFRIKNE